jgi:hypothetical protein
MDAPTGNYVYQRAFTVPSLSTLTLSGYAVDDSVVFKLDGVQIATASSHKSLSGPVSVQVSSGPHTLEADVYNLQTYTGLILNAEVCSSLTPPPPPTQTPSPGTQGVIATATYGSLLARRAVFPGDHRSAAPENPDT